MRLVALGASNLTRGLQAVVATARQAWGPDVEVLAALGHGRSYGVTSRFLVRSLPGILECGLWRALEQEPAPARALVTDVGNDILYGHDVRRILGWVEECVARLQAVGAEVAITDLPLAGIRRLGPARFLFFRSLFVPSCRLSLEAVSDAAERVSDGLVQLAARRSCGWCACEPSGTASTRSTSAPATGGPPGRRSSARLPSAGPRPGPRQIRRDEPREQKRSSSIWRSRRRSAGWATSAVQCRPLDRCRAAAVCGCTERGRSGLPGSRCPRPGYTAGP